MLDPIVNFFTRVFQAIGRGIGWLIAAILWPFMAASRWYARRGWLIKGPIGIVLIGLMALYGYFIWNTQTWTGFDPNYVAAYKMHERHMSAGEQQTAPEGGTSTTRSCGRSMIADVAADLIDFNVDQNAWISSMILYKLGLFGMSWDSTPFLDNKASFQRGVNQAVRRTVTELVDNMARVRGTSQIDSDLQDARGNIQFDEYTWYFGINPFGPKTPTPSFYRSAARDLRDFNTRLIACNAVFDARADNLIQYLDRVANDIGATSAILRDRSENYDLGWFDTRADDRFWFAYGQLYAYYGMMAATHADFEDIIREKHLDNLFDSMETQFVSALRIQPAIIANGREDGWIMPTHLATIGFYILRVRSNLVEIRDVIAR